MFYVQHFILKFRFTLRRNYIETPLHWKSPNKLSFERKTKSLPSLDADIQLFAMKLILEKMNTSEGIRHELQIKPANFRDINQN